MNTGTDPQPCNLERSIADPGCLYQIPVSEDRTYELSDSLKIHTATDDKTGPELLVLVVVVDPELGEENLILVPGQRPLQPLLGGLTTQVT